MPRVQKPLRPMHIRYICDKCEIGDYLPTGVMLMCDPPKFPHECTSCGDEVTFTEKYPTIRYAHEGSGIDLDNYEQSTS